LGQGLGAADWRHEYVFEFLVGLAALSGGAVAAVAGFGIGSILTPTLAFATGTKLAVAAIAIPHFVGTAQRFWILRSHVDRRILVGFGIASAFGGLIGALIHVWISSRSLGLLFGALLLAAAAAEFTGWIEKVRWGRIAAWIAGGLSGVLGGLVGNQGGIRSAAMLGFDVPKESFIATATAVGLFVDAARLPVYLVAQWRDIARIWPLLVITTLGVVVGTVIGTRLLSRFPQHIFRRVIAVLLLALGIYMLVAGNR
jgi:uncharacterized protein